MTEDSFNPMDHIDAGIDGDTEPDPQVVEFEVDIEPSQFIRLPRVYPRLHELYGRTRRPRVGPPYAIVIERDALEGLLDPAMLAQVHTGGIPMGSKGPMTTVVLSTIHPPRVKTLTAIGSERYVDTKNASIQALFLELQRLDVQNRDRNQVFMDRRLRLGVRAYHYSRGGTPFRESRTGVELELLWIAVEI